MLTSVAIDGPGSHATKKRSYEALGASSTCWRGEPDSKAANVDGLGGRPILMLVLNLEASPFNVSAVFRLVDLNSETQGTRNGTANKISSGSIKRSPR